MSQEEYCTVMQEGEMLNASYADYPLYHAVLYGSKENTAKFSKRLSCAVKHLPLSVSFIYEYDTHKAVKQALAKTRPLYRAERSLEKDS